MSAKKTIALLFGGRSAEHKVSIQSATAVFDHLDKSRYEIVCVFIARDGRWKRVASPRVPAAELGREPFRSFLPWANGGKAAPPLQADLYFPVLHGPFGEDGTIQGLLELAGVPFVGPGVLASAAGMDKDVMKVLFQSRGLRVAGPGRDPAPHPGGVSPALLRQAGQPRVERRHLQNQKLRPGRPSRRPGPATRPQGPGRERHRRARD
jgi:hypothetical protein